MSDDEPADDTETQSTADAESADADAVLDELFATIESRKAKLPEDSYTTTLFTHEKGENYVLEKLGEELTEVILAAKDDDPAELQYESADLVYHLLVLLSMKGLTVDDLRDELRSRFH